MWRKKGLRFKLVPMLLALNLLSSCAKEHCEQNILPQFPYAGSKVADELENLSAEEYSNLWEWIARLNKLRQELEN